MIHVASLKPDSAAWLNQAPVPLPAAFPCSRRAIPCSPLQNSLFRHNRESTIKTLIQADYFGKNSTAEAPEKTNFPVNFPVTTIGTGKIAPSDTVASLGYRPDCARQARRLCLLGADPADIADFFEISIETYQDWHRHYPDFAEAIATGRRLADERVQRWIY